MTPTRKKNRLPEYDYSQNGAYFITICTKNREQILWQRKHSAGNAVGAAIGRPDGPCPLSAYGKLVEAAILQIPQKYPAIQVESYAVMPNHVHLLLLTDTAGRAMLAPTISQVIQQLKGWVTKRAGSSIWQKSFHDHVVRGEKDFQMIWQYIEANPQNWQNDCFYAE